MPGDIFNITRLSAFKDRRNPSDVTKEWHFLRLAWRTIFGSDPDDDGFNPRNAWLGNSSHATIIPARILPANRNDFDIRYRWRWIYCRLMQPHRMHWHCQKLGYFVTTWRSLFGKSEFICLACFSRYVSRNGSIRCGRDATCTMYL